MMPILLKSFFTILAVVVITCILYIIFYMWNFDDMFKSIQIQEHTKSISITFAVLTIIFTFLSGASVWLVEKAGSKMDEHFKNIIFVENQTTGSLLQLVRKETLYTQYTLHLAFGDNFGKIINSNDNIESPLYKAYKEGKITVRQFFDGERTNLLKGIKDLETQSFGSIGKINDLLDQKPECRGFSCERIVSMGRKVQFVAMSLLFATGIIAVVINITLARK